MMRAKIAVGLLVSAFVVISELKEPTRKILIFGDGLAGMVERVDARTLSLSNVYTGAFLDTVRGAAPVPTEAPWYQVSFYLPNRAGGRFVGLLHRQRLVRAYVVYFAPDSNHDDGFVYVPGANDAWSVWNHGTIVRPTIEGRWSYANRAWAHEINNAIAHARRLPAPSCGVDSSALIRRSDAVYPDVVRLAGLLAAQQVHLLCAFHGTLDGMLGQRAAASLMTDHGLLELTVFEQSFNAEAVHISSTVQDGDVITVLRAPDGRADSVFSADRSRFIARGRWLIETFDEHRQRDAAARALATLASPP